MHVAIYAVGGPAPAGKGEEGKRRAAEGRWTVVMISSGQAARCKIFATGRGRASQNDGASVNSQLAARHLFNQVPEITKSYEPRDVEKKWYAAWQQAGAFHAPGKGKSYSVVIPPPNVTGTLTMGHVLNNALQDILVRRARQEGRNALWIPGTDHAGIATQTVVERELRKTKVHRRDLGRDRFLEKVWDWRREKGDVILEQLKALGCSCDWDRTHFTMDPVYSRAVLEAFVRLFGQQQIYRGKRMVNWCPASQTALSDEEVIMKPVNGVMYEVR